MSLQVDPFFALSHQYVERLTRLRPIWATIIGLPGEDHHWGDLGPDGVAARLSLAQETRAALLQLGEPTSPAAEQARSVLHHHLEDRIAWDRSEEPYHDLNTISATFALLPMVLTLMPTGSAAAGETLIGRLADLPRGLAQHRALFEEGLARGQVAARRQIAAVLAQGRAQLKPPSVWARAAAPYADAPGCSVVVAAAEAAVAEFLDFLEERLLPHAPQRDGVGPERYLRAARSHLGTSPDLRAVYDRGWREIARLQAEAEQVAHQIVPGASPSQAAEALGAMPRWSVGVPEPFLSEVQGIIEEAVRLFDGRLLQVPPELLRLEVRLAQPGGKLGAYYSSPSADLSRPGAIWYQPGHRKHLPLYQERTTVVHEGIPGHHLQIGTQLMQNDQLSACQRLLLECTGFTEGWALYAERLADENGFFREPAERLGFLAGQLARAWRVVIDIGLHLDLPLPTHLGRGDRWTYEIAWSLLQQQAMVDPAVARSEVDRYLGWPGQAISYAVGMWTFLDLRENCRQRLGDKFDLFRFHQTILTGGTLGLDLLRSRLDAHVQAELAR